MVIYKILILTRFDEFGQLMPLAHRFSEGLRKVSFLGVSKWHKMLPKGPGWGFGGQLADDAKTTKMVIFWQNGEKIGTYSPCSSSKVLGLAN